MPDHPLLISNVATLRKQKQLTQLELAMLTGVTETTVANWERGRKGLDSIHRFTQLCKLLNCQPQELLEWDNPDSQTTYRGILNQEPMVRSRIAILRKEQQITQKELAKKLGVTETTIANWENDRKGLHSLDKLIRLCGVLQCNLEDLVTVLEPGNPKSMENPRKNIAELKKLIRSTQLPVPHSTHPKSSNSTDNYKSPIKE